MRKLKAPRLTVKAKTGLVLLFIILLTSVLAPVLAPYDPLVSNLSEALQKPSAAHLLGTDNIGRDTLSRVLYGGRQSILLALAATVLSMLLGFVLGLFAGYFGGWIDGVITTISSIFVINSWVGFSRIARGEVMKLKQESFIKGLKTIGASDLRILFLHISPNFLGTLCVLFATRIAGNVISVASMSYLGLGLQPPTPDWGVMINDARQYFRQEPLLVVAPGLCILLLSLSINLLADELRDRLDVRKDVMKNM